MMTSSSTDQGLPGLLTIYSTTTCRHCRAAKALLATKAPAVKIRVIDVDLLDESVRQDMAALAHATSVPQIFLNAVHLPGGNSGLQELQARGELDGVLGSGLKEPPSEYVLSEMPGCAPHHVKRIKFSMEKVGVAGLVYGAPEERRIRSILKALLQSSSALISGHALVDLINTALGNLGEAGNAQSLGQRLLDLRIVQVYEEEAALPESATAPQPSNTRESLSAVFSVESIYQPTFRASKYVINTLYELPSDEASSSAQSIARLVASLREETLSLYAKHLQPDGSAVDYQGCKTSESFLDFQIATCELQRISVQALARTLSLDERKAFFINLYNTLVIHGHIVVGHPDTPDLRNAFFGKCAYIIGGQTWTLDYIEHAALRGNRPKPFAVEPLLPSEDERLALKMPEVDCRVHFALNCGAKSCPPIKMYTASSLNSQLDEAARAFCEDDANLRIVDATHISLSKILFWYGGDFAPTPNEVLRVVAEFLQGSKKTELLAALESGNKALTISYFDYDWSENTLQVIP